MHINLSKTVHVIFFVVFLSILSGGVSYLFSKIIPNPPFWFESLSPLGVYALLYLYFKKRAWKWKIFSYTGIVCVPNLNGRWKGTQKSSYDAGSTELETYIEIKQDFSEIKIKGYYERSEFKSVMATFTEIYEECYLYYIFDNEPNSGKVGTMEFNKGATKLSYLPEENKLIGTYFNSRGHYGEMVFDFESEKLLQRMKE